VSSNLIGSGGSITVALSGTGWLTKTTFQGFVLQAREEGTDTVVGSFDITGADKVKYVQCQNIQDTVTHSDNSAQDSVVVKWNAPSEYTGSVAIVATVLQDYVTYWVKHRSTSINVTLEPVTEPQPETETEPTTEPEDEPETTPEPEPEPEPKHTVFDGCFSKKGCFGMPKSCEASGDCEMMATWRFAGDFTEMELFRKSGSGNYVALGLSMDDLMGDDLVLSCAVVDGNPTVESSWNFVTKQNKMIPEIKDLQTEEANIEDGKNLYCKLRIPNFLEVATPELGGSQFMFELDNKKYHVLLAGGSYSDKLTFHTSGALSSLEPVSLSQVGKVGAASDFLFKLHGVLMVAAWIGCAGCGIILARYFKQTWKDSDCCGKAAWFQWHRLLMGLAWVLTIAGVVVVAIRVKGWNYDMDFIMKNPHPVLGVATLVLAFIQPFMAACRPDPDSSSRWIFNWAHWFIGNAAHIVAIITMFFAIDLGKAQLHANVTWIVVGYVAFHVTAHLALSINMCWAEHTIQPMSEIYPMTSSPNSANGYIEDLYVTKDKRGGAFRKFCFGLYFVIVWALAILLILLILMAPIDLGGSGSS